MMQVKYEEKNTVIRPNYRNGGIVNLMSSLRQGLGGPPGLYDTLDLLPSDRVKEAANVVLLVIDGLGYNYLRRHGRKLKAHLRGSMTTVFPSSTAPAITTFLTGVAPQQHGVSGWFMFLKELGTVAMILPFQPRWGGGSFASAGVDVKDLISAPPLFDSLEVRSHFVIPRPLIDTPYTVAAAGRAERVGYLNLVDCFHIVESLIKQGAERQYLYAYWPLFDALAHDYGVNSPIVKKHYLELDRCIDALIKALGGTDTLLVVTSDHGFVDTAPSLTIRVEDHPELSRCLALPLCGEPRLAYCYVRPGKSRNFERYVSEALGESFELYPSERLLADDWFGSGEPTPKLLERIGDYILIPKGNRVIKDTLPMEGRWDNVGIHGGTSEDEMLVPLVLAHC